VRPTTIGIGESMRFHVEAIAERSKRAIVPLVEVQLGVTTTTSWREASI